MNSREQELRKIFDQLMNRPYTVSSDWGLFYGTLWEGLKSKKFSYSESFLREFFIFMPRYELQKWQEYSEDFKRELENNKCLWQI